MAPKSFDTGTRKRTYRPGEEFTLGGETFRTCDRSDLPGAVGAALAAAVELTPQGEKLIRVPNVVDFIEQCLYQREADDQDPRGWRETNEVARFRRVVWGGDADVVVPIEVLTELFLWLNEVMAQRPTGRPSA